jgi:hypothetical protein
VIHVHLSEREIAPNEISSELVRGLHYDEGSGGGIDDEVARLGGGGDQPLDQFERLGVRVKFAINSLSPTIRDAVVAPGRARFFRRLLQHQQIVTAVT